MSKESEILDFTMDPQMLHDIINRQAGRLEKGALEATMNGIEAGATDFKIYAKKNGDQLHVSMVDNGKGIETRKELEAHFRKFGTPHIQSENKKWAEFRMGRGQCFAQGINTWTTAGWIMKTNVREDQKANRPPRFELIKSAEYFNGCKIDIEVYPDKFNGSVEKLGELIREEIEFVDANVFFNDKQVNRPPKKLEWDYEDDDAYYLFGIGTKLIIYNMGVKCQALDASYTGCVGVVVSKQKLRVNFARNEVMTDCPVMNRINKIIRKNRVKKTRTERRWLTDEERIATLRDLRDGDQHVDYVISLGMFYTSSNKSLSLRDIISNRIPWSIAERGNQVADKLMQSGQALIISDETIKALNYTGDEKNFFKYITGGDDRVSKVASLYRPFSQLSEGFSQTHTFVPKSNLTKFEKRLLRVLNDLANHNNLWKGRVINLGLSDTALAWTDGKSYICLERDWVKRRKYSLCNPEYAVELMHLLCHELAHDENSAESHVHGEEFYRNFHDMLLDNQYNPVFHASLFAVRMRKAIQQERIDDQIRRDQREKDKIDAKLNGGKKKTTRKTKQKQNLTTVIAARHGKIINDNGDTEAGSTTEIEVPKRRKRRGARSTRHRGAR